MPRLGHFQLGTELQWEHLWHFFLCVLSGYAAPFDFNFQIAIVRWYLDLIRREINFATIVHTLAVEMTTVENIFRTRFATEGSDDTRDLSHGFTLPKKTSKIIQKHPQLYLELKLFSRNAHRLSLCEAH